MPVQHQNLRDVLLPPQPTDAVSRLSSGFHQRFSPSQENLVNATKPAPQNAAGGGQGGTHAAPTVCLGTSERQSKMHSGREALAFCESLVVGLESFLISTET